MPWLARKRNGRVPAKAKKGARCPRYPADAEALRVSTADHRIRADHAQSQRSHQLACCAG